VLEVYNPILFINIFNTWHFSDALSKMSKNVRKKLKSLTQQHPGWKKVHYTSEERIISHKFKGIAVVKVKFAR